MQSNNVVSFSAHPVCYQRITQTTHDLHNGVSSRTCLFSYVYSTFIIRILVDGHLQTTKEAFHRSQSKIAQ